MEKLYLNFLSDRIDALLRDLPKTNAEYAVAEKKRNHLYDLLDPVLCTKEPLTISPTDCQNFREYLDQEATVGGIAQEEAYRLGCRDCVVFLRTLGVLA